MAISLVASAVAAGSSTAVSVAVPTGTTSGDRVYVVVSHNDETVTTTDNNSGTPTIKQGEYEAQSGGSGGQSVFYRTAGSSEPSSYAFTLSSSQRWVAVSFTLRGMSSSAFSVVPALGIVSASPPTTPTCPGITTLVANEWVFAVASIDNAVNGVFTDVPAGYTEIKTENTQQPTSVAYKLVAAAGAEADALFTKTSAGANGWYTLSLFSVAPATTSTSWVGMYYAGSSDIAGLVAKGVTRFQTFENQSALITAIGAAGGKAWVELCDVAGGGSVFSGTTGYNASALQTIVNATAGIAHVEGYFSNDESDLKGYSVAKLQQAYTDIKAITSKPVALTLRYPSRTAGPNGIQYVDATGPVCFDVLNIDAYPVPYVSPDVPASYGSYIRAEVLAALGVASLGGRAVNQVVQAFTWGIPPPPGFPSSPPARRPNVAETTAMGTAAREAGAANLWMYLYSDMDSTVNSSLGSITAIWVAIGHVASGFGRLLGMVRNRLVRTSD